jgi:carboxylesterase
MKRAYLPGAEPFALEGGKSGVLLFHGFSGSCFEVRALAGELNAAGFGVLAPALAGHGTVPDDLAGITCDEFFAHAEEAYRHAARRHRRLAVVGLSMGGTLGLHVAARYPIAGLVTISTPVFMSRLVSVSVPLANRFIPQRRVISNYAAWRNEVVGYRTTPVSSLAVFLEVLNRVRRELSYVSQPLLAIHSANDTTVPRSQTRPSLPRRSQAVRNKCASIRGAATCSRCLRICKASHRPSSSSFAHTLRAT